MLISNSQDRLVDSIRQYAESEEEIDKIISDIVEDCNIRGMDFSKVAEEVTRVINKTPNIYRISSFVRRVVAGIDRRVFRARNGINYIPNTQPLVDEMRRRKIVVSNEDTSYLYILWDELINHYKVDFETARNFNDKVINHMKPTQTFEDYISLLKRSKTLKPFEIDWDAIDKKAEESLKKWNEYLRELPWGDDD